MLFNSLEFLLLFLPLTLLTALHIKRSSLLLWICVASSIFYMFAGHAWFLLPMFFTTILDFYVGKALGRTLNPRLRKTLLVLSLTSNLGLLAFFKYLTFVLSLLYTATHLSYFQSSIEWVRNMDWVLPAGISFYTFQTISYVIDVYQKEAEPESNFLMFVGFVTFFPHLVAGPLTRHNQLIPQLKRIEQFGISPEWQNGVYLFFLGLCKKVIIADRIANIIDPFIGEIGHSGAIPAWLALIGYSLQIYFDFSGYSDMAIGLGRLFGIELPKNFDSPYQSKDPREFWRRWHITLSQWLRDYLYFSLGGNRRGELRRNLSLMITMLLGGLWHGANLTFLCWGAYHGILLVLHHRFQNRWERLPVPSQKIFNCLAIWLGWVFFRAESIVVAGQWYRSLFFINGLGTVPGFSVPLLVIPVGLVIALFFKNSAQIKLTSLNRIQTILLALTSTLAILLVNYSSRFLYFQF